MSGIEPVLLLHGQPGAGQDWDLVLIELAARASAHAERRVVAIAPDRPGYDGISAARGLAGNAQWVIDRLNQEGFERATIVGLSFGAAVAAWVASEHPERVGKLVLVSPAANRASLVATDRLMAAPVAGRVISDSMLLAAGLASRWGWLRDQLERRFGVPGHFQLRAGDGMLRRVIRRTFLVEQRAIVAEMPELDRRLGTITTPTTIVEGTFDRVVPPDAAYRLARQIKGAQLVTVERGRHLLSVTHPALLAQLITEDREDATTGED